MNIHSRNQGSDTNPDWSNACDVKSPSRSRKEDEPPQDANGDLHTSTVWFRPRVILAVGEDPITASFNANTKKFVEAFPEIRKRADRIESEIKELNHNSVVAFAHDFYDAYFTSSGYLTDLFGPAFLLQTFHRLKLYYPLVRCDDWEVLQNLPDELIIYRGGRAPKESLSLGFSWSHEKSIAEQYMDSPGDLLLTTKIKKSQLLAYYTTGFECIVDPADLTAPTSVAQTTICATLEDRT